MRFLVSIFFFFFFLSKCLRPFIFLLENRLRPSGKRKFPTTNYQIDSILPLFQFSRGGKEISFFPWLPAEREKTGNLMRNFYAISIEKFDYYGRRNYFFLKERKSRFFLLHRLNSNQFGGRKKIGFSTNSLKRST